LHKSHPLRPYGVPLKALAFAWHPSYALKIPTGQLFRHFTPPCVRKVAAPGSTLHLLTVVCVVQHLVYSKQGSGRSYQCAHGCRCDGSPAGRDRGG